MTVKIFKTIVPIIFILFGAVFFIFPTHIFAATITVDSLLDTSVDADGDCTLRQAIQNANSDNIDTTGGDCVTGTGADTISFSVTGTISAGSAFDVITDADTTITGPGSGLLTINATTSSDSEVFTISNVNGNSITGMTISNVKSRAIYILNADNNTIDDVVITGRTNLTGSLIEVFSGSDNNTISNCDVSLGYIGLRIIANSNYNTVDSCNSHDNDHSGLTIYDSSNNTLNSNTVENIGANGYGLFVIAGADNNTISGNTIINNVVSGILIGDVGADLAPTTTNTFTGNTITGNGNMGISFNAEVENSIFEDNIISDNTNGGIQSSLATSDLQFIGNTITANGGPGINISGTTNITIGGSLAGDRNVISGNAGNGITLDATTALIAGNYIGVAANGTTLSANTGDGIQVTGSGITIGGDTSLERNVIAGNTGNGIEMDDITTGIITGNYIGVDSSGTTVVANGADGIDVATSSNITIGGDISDERNIISGNTADGISFDTVTTGLIAGNYIGVDSTGTADAGNGTDGINAVGSSGITIGGDTAGERNVISGNGNDGIFFDTVTTGTITGNYIGVGSDGTTAIGNDSDGIEFIDTTTLAIGGSVSGESNLIIGNTEDGIVNSDDGTTTDSSDVSVVDNTISQNGFDGIMFSYIDTVTLDSNIIGSNGQEGIDIVDLSTATITGNYIGFDATGDNADSNTGKAFKLQGVLADIDIGGTTSDERNYIYYLSDGDSSFSLNADSSSNIAIKGNYINVNTAGDVLSGGGGLSFTGDLSGVVVGGTVSGSANVISGLTDAVGINITGSDARVFGNYIGTNTSGVVESGYGNNIGVLVYDTGATGNQVGGVNTGEGNIIAGNEVGVIVAGASGGFANNNSVLGNSIMENEFGIDLIEDLDLPSPVFGHTANDSGDGDSGPNDFLNHPVITGVNATTDVVTYSLDVPSGYYRVEFFKNPTEGLDDSGYGEGEEFVQAVTVQSAGSALSNQTITITEGVISDDVITATVTECTDNTCTAFLGTSEFSDSETTSGSDGGGDNNGSSSRGAGVRTCTGNRETFCKKAISPTPVLPQQSVPASTPVVFSRNLELGAIGEDVRTLQKFLNTHGFQIAATGPGSPGNETNLFGGGTKAALIKFQKAHNLVPSIGYFGPLSRAKVISLMQSSLVAPSVPVASSVPISSKVILDRNLELGMTGEDVRQLQRYLIEQKSGSAAQALAAHGVTNNFGPLTQKALIEFQKSVGISPAVGYFGPVTREFITK